MTGKLTAAAIAAAACIAIPATADAHAHHAHHAKAHAHVRHRAHKADVEGDWGAPGWNETEWETEMIEAGFTPAEMEELR